MPNTEQIAWRHYWLKSVMIGQAFPYENSSPYGNQTHVLIAASGKTSLYASCPRTTAIMDGKVVSIEL